MWIFLPTPSVRRATENRFYLFGGKDISTHALREEGDRIEPDVYRRVGLISTHALREEGDLMPRSPPLKTKIFLPTPSVRRATWGGPADANGVAISTHALREEGDSSYQQDFLAVVLFLPTPSVRRATSRKSMCGSPCTEFLPTPSVRRATSSS